MMQSIMKTNYEKMIAIQANGYSADGLADPQQAPTEAAAEPVALPAGGGAEVPAPDGPASGGGEGEQPEPKRPEQLEPEQLEPEQLEPEPEPEQGADEPDPLIELSVGGCRYTAALSTLTALPTSALPAMLSAGTGSADSADAIATIDRDGPSFRWVLVFLRWVAAGSVPPLSLPQDGGERLQLAEEAAFFGLPELEERCRRPRLSQFELLQLLATLPAGGRLAVGGCDPSGLHVPEGAVERMDLGGCLLEGAVIDGAHREALEQRGPLGLDSVRWQ